MLSCSFFQGVEDGISPQLTLYLLSFALPYVGHVCALIVYEVMEMYSYAEPTPCAKLMNCET